MLNPRSGRPTPRMAETPRGMLNSIGLQGPGIDAFLDKDLAWLRERGARTVVSIAGGSVDEYHELAPRLRHEPASPRSRSTSRARTSRTAGRCSRATRSAAGSVMQAVRRNTDPGIPVLAKLARRHRHRRDRAVGVDAGADGLSMINTLLGMVIDTDTMRPTLAGITGGLSGPAIRPVAVRCVWQVHAALPDVPILGHGRHPHRPRRASSSCSRAPARCRVGTVMFHDPQRPGPDLRASCAAALAERGFAARPTRSATPTVHRRRATSGGRSPGTAHVDDDEPDTTSRRGRRMSARPGRRRARRPRPRDDHCAGPAQPGPTSRR